MMFDSRDIENKIKTYMEYKIKNNEFELNSDFCLLRIYWDNSNNIDNDMWSLMKDELKNKIKFNYLFDYIKITSIDEKQYIINTMKNKYELNFNTIVLNNINFKEILCNDFNNYLNNVNYSSDDLSKEKFDLDNYLCLFIKNKCSNVYNLKFINNKNEIIMLCNLLSNIINNNLV
tara:strand:+ start:4026 stop:4550 length:525 start_codon:yes stop_codon:yes gene_type:complete